MKIMYHVSTKNPFELYHLFPDGFAACWDLKAKCSVLILYSMLKDNP